jgi:hypothetical protein
MSSLLAQYAGICWPLSPQEWQVKTHGEMAMTSDSDVTYHVFDRSNSLCS